MRAIATLESCRGMRVAEKALNIQRALGPRTSRSSSQTRPRTASAKSRRFHLPCADSSFSASTLRGFSLAPSRGLALETTPYHRPLSPAHIRTHQDHDHDPDPDLAQPLCPNAQGTTVNVQESERMPILPQAPSAPMLQPQHATCEHPPPKFRWLCEDLDVGDLARYLEQGQQGHPAATQQPQEQRHRNAALPPRQPAETKKRCGDLRRTTHRRRQ